MGKYSGDRTQFIAVRQQALMHGQHHLATYLERTLQQQIKCVDDATVDSRDAGNANQLLANEGSLVSIPIVFSCGADDPQPVGVLGLSSPYKRDISRVEHLPVVHEIQALLSSLFYASAMAAARAAGKRLTTRQVAALLRREIAGYFDERQRHPNRARTSEFTVPAAQRDRG